MKIVFYSLLITALVSCEKSLLLISNEKAAEFVVQGDTAATVNGVLGKTAHKRFEKMLIEHPGVHTLILENVPGSMNDEYNMQTGRLVREKSLTTEVRSYSKVASGGVDLFCAGKKRIIENGAMLGVHSWSEGKKEATDYPKNDPAHNAQTSYFSEMLGDSLGPIFYFYTIYAAPADSIHWMTTDEIEYYQLEAFE